MAFASRSRKSKLQQSEPQLDESLCSSLPSRGVIPGSQPVPESQFDVLMAIPEPSETSSHHHPSPPAHHITSRPRTASDPTSDPHATPETISNVSPHGWSLVPERPNSAPAGASRSPGRPSLAEIYASRTVATASDQMSYEWRQCPIEGCNQKLLVRINGVLVYKWMSQHFSSRHPEFHHIIVNM